MVSFAYHANRWSHPGLKIEERYGDGVDGGKSVPTLHGCLRYTPDYGFAFSYSIVQYW